MRFALPTILSTVFAVSQAHAHSGHLAAEAGHSHWLGVAAAVVAIAIAIGGCVHLVRRVRSTNK